MKPLSIKIRDLDLSYYAAGNGSRNLIFIHGNSSSGEVFKLQLTDSSLCQKFTLYALDLPGHGRSNRDLKAETDPYVYSLDYYVDTIVSFCQKLSLNSPMLVGHSLGGHIALGVSAKMPLSGLIVVGTPPLEQPADLATAFNPLPELATLFTAISSVNEISNLKKVFKLSSSIFNFEATFSRTDPKCRSNLLAAIQKKTFLGEVSLLKDLNIPVQVVYTKDDLIISSHHMEEVQRKVLANPKIEFTCWNHGGHFPQIDSPDIFNPLIHSFAY